MKVLVSYLGRNQIFSLEEDQIRDLKQKISLYLRLQVLQISFFSDLTKNGIVILTWVNKILLRIVTDSGSRSSLSVLKLLVKLM